MPSPDTRLDDALKRANRLRHEAIFAIVCASKSRLRRQEAAWLRKADILDADADAIMAAMKEEENG